MNYSYVGTVVLRKPKMLGSRNERQIVGAKHHRLGLAVETGKFIDMIALLLIFLARKGAKRLSLIDIFAVIAVVYKRKLVAEVLLEKLFLIGTKTAKAKLFAFLLNKPSDGCRRVFADGALIKMPAAVASAENYRVFKNGKFTFKCGLPNI